MQSLVVSTVRFSIATTLFGLEQLRSAANAGWNGQEWSALSERLAHTLDEMATSVTEKLGENRRTAVRSISESGSKMIDSALAAADPRRMTRGINKIARGLAGVLVGGQRAHGNPQDAPQLAVDVFPSS